MFKLFKSRNFVVVRMLRIEPTTSSAITSYTYLHKEGYDLGKSHAAGACII